MDEKPFSNSQVARAGRLKEDQLYRSGGFRKAVVLKRNFADYQNHFFAFLIDLNICLLPVYLWAVEFILILSGVISPLYFDMLFYVMYACLFLASCILLPLYTASCKGQSYGCQVVGLKLVRSSKKSAPAMKIVLRQLIGFGVPMMLFGYFFSVFGLLGWWFVNGLVVLISPRQQTIADWIFSTILVYTPNYDLRMGEETIEQDEESSTPPDQPVPEEDPIPQEEAQPEETEEAVQEEIRSPLDLHIRSSYSDDGSYDVEEIFRQAKENGMEIISITDHNNARANAQAARFTKLYGVKYIPGVEIDTRLYGERVRILGYYIDWTDPVFDEIERNSLKREKDLSLARIAAFEKAVGVRIDVDSLLARSRFKILTADDLTSLVFKDDKARNLPTVKKFLDSSANEQEAREKFKEEYFGPGSVCDVQAEYPDTIKIIDAIHKAGGMAVLSAWHAGDLSDDVLEGLLDGGIDGLEAFSPELSEDTAKFLLTIASQEKLFLTAGSDYHGAWKPERKMGVTHVTPKGEQLVRIFARGIEEQDTLG